MQLGRVGARGSAAVVLGLVAGLAACGSSASSGSATHGGSAGASSASAVSGGAASGASGPLAGLHGIVGIEQAPGGGTGSALEVFDPATGHLTRTVPIPWTVTPGAVFTADWTYAASGMPGLGSTHGVVLGRFDGTGYRQVGTWSPQASLSGGVQQYADPTFERADGRLWFAQRSVNQAQASTDDVWYSVDPAQPSDPLRREQHPPPTTDPDGRVVTPRELSPTVEKAGDSSTAKVVTSATGLLSATVDGTWAAGANGFPQFVLYRCEHRITAQELLCLGSGQQDAAGAVVGLSLRGAAGPAVLRQIFPPASGGTTIQGAYLSPDGTRVLLATGSAWFVGPVSGSANPAQAFPALEGTPLTILGWY